MRAKHLKIFIGESDRVYGRPLYESIVYAARKAMLAGATVSRGVMSFGADSKIHTTKIFALAEDLPIIIDIIDEEGKIIGFIEIVEKLFNKANSGGMITVQDAEIVKYTSRID